MKAKMYLFPVDRIKRIHIEPHDYQSCCRCGPCTVISMQRIADAMDEADIVLSDLKDVLDIRDALADAVSGDDPEWEGLKDKLREMRGQENKDE